MEQGESQSLPRIWVATRVFGGASEPWLWRQTVGFTRVCPRVVCWQRLSPHDYPGGLSEVVVPHPMDPMSGVARHAYRMRNLRGGNFFASLGDERKWLTHLATEDAPELILCHFGHMALRMLPIAAARGVPLVAHFHGLDVSSGLRNKWYRWSLAKCLQRFAAIIVVGSHQRQWMLEQGVPDERIHLIPCGVPVAEFWPSATPHSGPVRFVCVSRLAEFKGVDYSLRAFAQVRATVPDVTLTIIGDGPERDRLTRLVESLALTESVRMLGPIPASEVLREMQAADVFLQHSLEGRDGWVEGFGVSITEASACALPVVVTDCGGIADQVIDGETGFISAQRDVDAFAAGMARLVVDPELRRRLGRAGRARVEAAFDTADQIRRLEDVLLECIRTRDPACVQRDAIRSASGG